MKYRVLDSTLTAISQGEFLAVVKDGLVELPDSLAADLIAAGMVTPARFDTEYQETAEDDGLRQPERRQSRARKRRND